MMCRCLFIALPILLFVGPIRRWFFAGAWRFIVPLFTGFLIGVPIAQMLIARGGAPPEAKIILPIFASLMIAVTLKGVIDEISKPGK